MSEAESLSAECIVDTTLGPIQGRVKNDVVLFCGVPYAAAPIAEKRFLPPHPHTPWQEVRAATKFSPAAPQLPSGGMTNALPVRWDEDCLYLNICTPALDKKKRPVLFWIHGGAYRSGQGAVPWYDGAEFANNGDIVVVSINYRLGALGFTNLARFGDKYANSGANGTLDQIAALQWVVDNIENFGGDHKQITVAGESAGAFSVATLMASPLSEHLLQRAIPQSGAGHHTMPAATGELVAEKFMAELGVSTIEELLEASADDILKAQTKIEELAATGGIPELEGVMPFYPSTGNDAIPVAPITAFHEGAGSNIDVLVGTNKDESTLFIMPGQIDTEEKLTASAARIGVTPEMIAEYKEKFPGASPYDLAVQIQTDYSFRIPALRMAEARFSGAAKTFMYLFAWESRTGHLKSTHALEIPFAFNNLKKAGVDAFIGPGEVPQSVADEMHQAWIGFIQSGEPGWGEYVEQTRLTQWFDTESKLVNDPDDGKRQAWEGIR